MKILILVFIFLCELSFARMYVVVPRAQLTTRRVSFSLQRRGGRVNLSTIRCNLANTQCLLSYIGKRPGTLSTFPKKTKAETVLMLRDGTWEPMTLP